MYLKNPLEFLENLNTKCYEFSNDDSTWFTYKTDGAYESIDNLDGESLYSDGFDHCYDENDRPIPVIDIMIENVQNKIAFWSNTLASLIHVKENS